MNGVPVETVVELLLRNTIRTSDQRFYVIVIGSALLCDTYDELRGKVREYVETLATPEHAQCNQDDDDPYA